jgi:hypothetical protein
MKGLLFTVAFVGVALSLGACSEDDAPVGGGGQGGETASSGGSGTASGGTDDNAAECPAPSDTLETDDLSPGASSVICYYAPSEGYCRELTSEFAIQYAEDGDKGAMGCTDAVVVTGGTCPMDTAVGRCVNWAADESRVYYECNKFDSIYPDGLEKGCTDLGGTWEAF